MKKLLMLLLLVNLATAAQPNQIAGNIFMFGMDSVYEFNSKESTVNYVVKNRPKDTFLLEVPVGDWTNYIIEHGVVILDNSPFKFGKKRQDAYYVIVSTQYIGINTMKQSGLYYVTYKKNYHKPSLTTRYNLADSGDWKHIATVRKVFAIN